MSPFALFCRPALSLACLLVCGLAVGTASAAGEAPPKETPKASPAAAAKLPAPPSAGETKTPPPANDPGTVIDRIRSALAQQQDKNQMHVLVGDQPLTSLPHRAALVRQPPSQPNARPRTKAKSPVPSVAVPAAPAPAPRWAYTGAQGPEQWGQLAPDYGTCASGQRQSPIAIDTRQTLQGPAEPLQLAYAHSGGRVAHTGHTIQVDVGGQNTLTVRGSRFQLQHLQFHHPAEIRIDDKTPAMAVHLLHRNEQGQMAMLVVPLEVGEPHPEIHKIWTHLPLEVNDSVPLPADLLNPQALLPKDPNYYQFMGSLSAPPCTEGVLWLVMKQAVTISPEQLRLFAQLFPMNARPLQALNGRVVREGM